MFGGLYVCQFVWNRWFVTGNTEVKLERELRILMKLLDAKPRIEHKSFKTQRYNRTEPQVLGTVKKQNTAERKEALTSDIQFPRLVAGSFCTILLSVSSGRKGAKVWCVNSVLVMYGAGPYFYQSYVTIDI